MIEIQREVGEVTITLEDELVYSHSESSEGELESGVSDVS